MSIKYLFLLIGLLFSFYIGAQDNVDVNYKDNNSFPDFLNICGDDDSAIVSIEIDPLIRLENNSLIVELNMFPGILFTGVDLSSTSSEISVTNNDLSNPTFEIDLTLNSDVVFDLGFTLKADCVILDTLNQNNTLQLYNSWTFSYDSNETHISETDNNLEYLDALAISYFSFSETVVNNPVKVGACKEREISITNSGLDGFVDSLTYEIVQGAGESFQSITLNGVALDFTTDVLTNGDTSILVKLTGNDFISAFNGNGDQHFDQDESLVFVETICVVDCNLNNAAQHYIRWGCDGQLCSSNSYESYTAIGAGDPHASVAVDVDDLDIIVGYCQDGSTSIEVTNTGFELDEGFGVMYDVSANIGLGTYLELTDGAFTITELKIGSVTIINPQTLNDLDGNIQFTSDPDGPGGLEDFDGDGYFDDLRIDETFTMSANYQYDCSLSNSVDDFCTNDLSVSISAIIFYTNSCNERLLRNQSDYLHPSNTSNALQNFSDPDAFKEGDVFYVTHLEERNVRNFDVNCDSQQYLEVQVELPVGIQLVSTETELIKNGNGSLPISDFSLDGNIATLKYDISSNDFINGNYKLVLAFTADCNTELGLSVFPTTFTFVCPNCDCHHVWYCDDIVGPVIHGTNPPCNDSQSNTCPIGIRTTDFNVERISFGYADNGYTIPFDESIANKNAAISCDLVKMSINSVIGEISITDSIGFDIQYSNIDDTNDPSNIFDFRSGSINFAISSGNVVYDLTQSDFDVIIDNDNGNKIMRFDLSHVISDLNLTLNSEAIISFEGVFALNPDGPFITKFRRVPNFRANSYHTHDGEKIVCDRFGKSFTISKVSTVFSLPSNSKHPKGCEDTQLDFRLNTINNGYASVFGNEKREAILIDSIILDYDPSFLDAFDSIKVKASLPGHPVYGNDFFEITNLSLSDNGHYVAHFDTLGRFPSLDEVNSYAFVLRVEATPKCLSLTGSSNNDNVFNMSPSIYFKDRYYAKDIGDGSCVNVMEIQKSASVYYSEELEFSFNALSNPSFELVGDTAVWVLKHCNTSFESSVPLVWISLENMSGNIIIESIEDISNLDNIISLPLKTFGPYGNSFAYGNGLLEASSLNSVFDICNTYRIKATLTDCSNTSLIARVGWNCSNYADTWNPGDNAPCKDDIISLNIVPKSPFLDANVVGQPLIEEGICDTVIVDVLVKNTDLAAAFDVGANIYIPEFGTEFLEDEIYIQYPAGGAFENVSPNVSFDGIDFKGKKIVLDNLFLNGDLNENGLLPFNLISPNQDNQFVLRYKFLTDCDFVGGSLSYYELQGVKGCSDLTNIASGETAPLFINPITSNLNSYVISVDTNSFITPTGESTVSFDILNIGSTNSIMEDIFTITLPESVTYVPSSTLGVLPSTWIPGEPTISLVGGTTVLTWNIIPGVIPMDIASLQFSIVTPTLDCNADVFNLKASIITNSEVACIIDNSTCIIESIISTNNPIIEIPISNLDFTILTSNMYSTCLDDDLEEVTSNLIIQNQTGSPISQTLNYHYYFDSNGDEVIDGGDVLVYSSSIILNINDEEIFEVDNNFVTSSSIVCGLLLYIENEGLTTCGEVYLSLETPQIDNVQSVFESCASSDINQLFITEGDCGNGYEYMWSAIEPANINDISDVFSSDVTISFENNGNNIDTLIYILTTTRVECSISTSDTLQIIRYPGVSFTLGDDISILPGGSVDLVPSLVMGIGTLSYNWEPNDQFINPSLENQTLSPISDQIFTLTITDENNCTFSDEISILIGDEIVASVNSSSVTICENESIDLVASGGDTYLWFENSLNPTSGNLSSYSTANITFNGFGVSGAYSYGVIVSNSEFPDFVDTAIVMITINPNPVVSINSSASTLVCFNEEVILTGSGATTYEWYNESNTLIGSENTFDIIPSNNQVITLVGLNDSNCADTTLITFLIEDEITWNIGVQDIENCGSDTISVSLEISENIGMVNVTPDILSNLSVNLNTVTFDLVYPGDDVNVSIEIFDEDNNCSLVDNFNFNECSVICEYFDNNDIINYFSDNCDSTSLVCLSLDLSILDNYIVFDNGGIDIVNTLTICDTLGNYGVNLLPGEYTLVVMDTISFCTDTAIVSIACPITIPPLNCDTVYVNQDTIQYCIDGIDINGPVVGVDVLCTSGVGVQYLIDTLSGCVEYFSNETGVDTSCISFTYENGLSDTLFICLTTIITNVDWIYDTIYINEVVNFCLDDSELAGPIVSIDNFCPDLSGEYVNFILDDGIFCLDYEGLDIETDTACVVVCDDLNHCDTTYFSITVEEFTDAPMAVDDMDTVWIGGTITTPIKLNDDIIGGIDTAYILNEPTYGTVILNLDCSATYNASDEYCEREDTYDYVICNSIGLCDTATVFIWIECDDIVIFNALSANGDGVNDFFHIAGLDEYPDNNLTIINQWGNTVYQKDGYNNNWDGTWNNKLLPDGVYYYCLELGVDNRIYTGYIEIVR